MILISNLLLKLIGADANILHFINPAERSKLIRYARVMFCSFILNSGALTYVMYSYFGASYCLFGSLFGIILLINDVLLFSSTMNLFNNKGVYIIRFVISICVAIIASHSFVIAWYTDEIEKSYIEQERKKIEEKYTDVKEKLIERRKSSFGYLNKCDKEYYDVKSSNNKLQDTLHVRQRMAKANFDKCDKELIDLDAKIKSDYTDISFLQGINTKSEIFWNNIFWEKISITILSIILMIALICIDMLSFFVRLVSSNGMYEKLLTIAHNSTKHIHLKNNITINNSIISENYERFREETIKKLFNKETDNFELIKDINDIETGLGLFYFIENKEALTPQIDDEQIEKINQEKSTIFSIFLLLVVITVVSYYGITKLKIDSGAAGAGLTFAALLFGIIQFFGLKLFTKKSNTI